MTACCALTRTPVSTFHVRARSVASVGVGWTVEPPPRTRSPRSPTHRPLTRFLLAHGPSQVITVMFAADTDVDLTDWIIATAISAFGLPLGWLLWARSVYHANINDSFAEYAKFFVHGAFHIAWALWVIISPPCRVVRKSLLHDRSIVLSASGRRCC